MFSNAMPLVYVYKAELIEEVLKAPAFAEKSIGYEVLNTWLGKGLLTR